MTVIVLSAALGFFVASLIALFLAPPLWRRAVRLTTKRLTQQSPRMIDEGQADRDQMRAEFAVTSRKMEIKIDELKEEASAHLIQISKIEKKSDRQLGKIGSLQKTIESRDIKISELNQQAEGLQQDINKKSDEIAGQNDELTRQTEMLNTQATAAEASTVELESRNEQISAYERMETDLSAVISQQKTEIQEQLEAKESSKVTHNTANSAHRNENERLSYEIKNGLKEISRLRKDLGSRKEEADTLRQELGQDRRGIASLRRKVRDKDEHVRQLNLELLSSVKARRENQTAIDNVDLDEKPVSTISETSKRLSDTFRRTISSKRNDGTSTPNEKVETNDNNVLPVAALPANLDAATFINKADKSEPPAKPQRKARVTRTKPKATPGDARSLAERIRALQANQTETF